MKKTIMLLLLITNVVPTICMNEQLQPRQQTYTQQQKPLLFSPYSATEIPMPIYITANEPGWEKYNEIRYLFLSRKIKT